MASTQTPGNDVYTSGSRVIAFFSNKEDAYRAVNELREAQFTSAEIGLMIRDESQSNYGTNVSSDPGADNESFWQKLKDFFSGDSHEGADYRDSTSDYGWDKDRTDYYYNGINTGGALVSVTGPRAEQARTILQNAGGDLRENGFEASSTESLAGSGSEDQRIQLRGEVLRTYKERVQRGEVRLRKDVITENQTVQVPVTREELVVERVPASGERAASGGIGTDQEVRVPLSEERVRTEKQPVVTEEVRVGKRAVQSTENVSDDVRHEELRVDKDGDVNVDNEITRSGKRKKPAA